MPILHPHQPSPLLLPPQQQQEEEEQREATSDAEDQMDYQLKTLYHQRLLHLITMTLLLLHHLDWSQEGEEHRLEPQSEVEEEEEAVELTLLDQATQAQLLLLPRMQSQTHTLLLQLHP